MKKLTILFSLLSSVLIQSQVLALPNCPSAASVWNNCFGTHIWTSGEFRRDKYAGEWKDDQQHGLGTYYSSTMNFNSIADEIQHGGINLFHI